MAEQIIEINQLLKRYKAEIEKLEKQLMGKKEKVRVLYEAMKIMEQEKILQPTASLLNTESISEKYKEMSLNKAVLNILSNSEGYLDGNSVLNELLKNGFTSGSSDIRRDVFIALYRLSRDGKIMTKKIENRKKYILPLANKLLNTIEKTQK